MRSAWLIPLVVLWPLSAVAAPVTVKFELAGGDAGQNVFELKADGSFTSTTSAQLGPTKVDTTLTGRMVEGRVTEFQMDITSPPTRAKFTWDGKKAVVEAAGNRQERPLTLSGPLFSNYHPQLNRGLFRALSANVADPQKVTLTVLESLVTVQATLTPKPAQRIDVNGKPTVIRMMTAALGPIEMEVGLNEADQVVGQRVAAQQFVTLAEGYEGLFVDPVLQYKELSQPTFRVKKERAVKVKMRDGIELVHDAVLPDGEGKFPTILIRTPYGRAAQALTGDWWAKRGYVVIVQDVRGRDDSPGEWEPFLNERKDGADTINWIARQSWSDGKVGMIGASYSGYVQWAAAVERPAALKAIIPQVSPPDMMSNIPYEFGSFMLYANLWWSRIVADKQTNMASATTPLKNPDGLLALPLTQVDDQTLGKNIPFFDGWLKRQGLRDFPGSITPREMQRVGIPALHISGWWDGDGIGTKLNFVNLRRGGNRFQWLIYGPWSHAFNTTSKLGDVDYGPTAILELNSLYLRWFDTWLKGKEVGLERVPRVQAFLTGANQWLNLSDWPDPSMEAREMFLAAPEPANGASSRGQLLAKPIETEPSRYLYNPLNVRVPDSMRTVNPMDTSAASTRVAPPSGDSTLVFRSDALGVPLDVVGPIEAILYVSTTAKDADFFVSLVDIAPDGTKRAFGMPGKLRLSFRDGNDRPVPVGPGRVYRVRIQLWDTAHRLMPGHRLGLVLTSDAFPMFARNLGTGEPLDRAVRAIAAVQTVYHDPKRPSRIRFMTPKAKN